MKKHFSTCGLHHIGNVAGLLAALSLLFLVESCRKSFLPGEGRKPEMVDVSFSLDSSEPFGGVDVKSLLVASDIETRVTSVTLAAYGGGALKASGYYAGASQLSAMVLGLVRGAAYKVYAFVNMGDMRSSLPSSESALPSVAYVIPAYTGSSSSLETRGLPMAGSLVFVAGSSALPRIAVKRLVAKVEAALSCAWDGAKIASVKVCNLNGRLLPFGDSAAASDGDILPVREYSAGTLSPSGTFTFYVPENLQGTKSVATSADRRPDGGNAAISSCSGRLTYLEASVSAEGPRSGSKTYRSYLGGNATTDFSISRNTLYRWSITYTESGLALDDWKHEGQVSRVSHVSRYVITPEDRSYVFRGRTLQLGLVHVEIEYQDDVEVSRVSETVPASSYVFRSLAPEVVSVTAAGLLTGVAVGRAGIQAVSASDGSTVLAERDFGVYVWDDSWDEGHIDL